MNLLKELWSTFMYMDWWILILFGIIITTIFKKDYIMVTLKLSRSILTSVKKLPLENMVKKILALKIKIKTFIAILLSVSLDGAVVGLLTLLVRNILFKLFI